MKLLLQLLIVISFLSLISCSSKRNNYVLLIDNSKSISYELLEKYISLIQNIVLANMGCKDRITIQFIDECSVTKSERIFTVDFATMDFTNGADGKIHEDDSSKLRFIRILKDSIKPTLRNILLAKRKERQGCGNYTDILSAINTSKTLITSEKSYSSNLDQVKNNAEGKDNYEYCNSLIILSDMVNEDVQGKYDFRKMGQMDDSDISKRISELQASKKIPDLKNVKVFVYGATSTKESGALANKQIENIKSFWQQYFIYANADIQAYGYDSESEIKQSMVNNSTQ